MRFFNRICDLYADRTIVLRIFGRKHRKRRARARVAYRLLCILPFPADWECNIRKRLSVCRRQARRDLIGRRALFNDDLRCLSVRIIRLCDRTALLCLAKRRRPNIPCSHTFRKAVLVHAVRIVTIGKEMISVLQKPRNKEIRSRFDRLPRRICFPFGSMIMRSLRRSIRIKRRFPKNKKERRSQEYNAKEEQSCRRFFRRWERLLQ